MDQLCHRRASGRLRLLPLLPDRQRHPDGREHRLCDRGLLPLQGVPRDHGPPRGDHQHAERRVPHHHHLRAHDGLRRPADRLPGLPVHHCRHGLLRRHRHHYLAAADPLRAAAGPGAGRPLRRRHDHRPGQLRRRGLLRAQPPQLRRRPAEPCAGAGDPRRALRDAHRWQLPRQHEALCRQYDQTGRRAASPCPPRRGVARRAGRALLRLRRAAHDRQDRLRAAGRGRSPVRGGPGEL